jgi:hypothetical protein
MSRLRFSAFLLIALCAVGCSKKDSGDQSSDDDTMGDDKPGKTTDGGKPKGDAKVPSSTPDGGPQKRDASVMLPPGDIPDYMQDDTGMSGLSDGDIKKLKEGGDDCAAGSVLYPYDGVVYPVGLAPPTVMFANPVDGAYLKLTYDGVDNVVYEVAGGKSSPGEMTIPIDPWIEVTKRTKGQTLHADISFMAGGKVSTCHYKWKAAQGVLTGTVFYNTYNHPDLGGQGAVLRLPLGATESEVYLKYTGLPSIAGPCISCHSVSFNGERLAASLHNYSPFSQSFEADSYQIGADPQPPVLSQNGLPDSTFAAFTPKGDKILSMGNPQCTRGANAFPRAPNNFMLVPGPAVAGLHDTVSGAEIHAPGLNKDWYMWMPQFSPDGTKVVFNHAKPDGRGGTDRRELAIMDYDDATNTFSNLRVIVKANNVEPSIDYNPLPTLSGGIGGDCFPDTPSDVAAIPHGTCEGPCYPGWPFFTPDGSAVIYVLGSEPDFAAAFPGRDSASKSELWYVDIESGKAVKLANAGDGLKPEDAQSNYYPTVLPVSIGGYYWVFWTSMRDWGHRDTSPSPGQVASNWFGGTSVLNATRKRIWVTALRPPRSSEGFQEDTIDFSSKPFYLEGQSNSGNIRAFAALNPCKDVGGDCETGIDCCTGFCTNGKCAPPKTCGDRGEKCTDDNNCCPTTGTPLVCVNHFCDIVVQ